MHVILSPSTEDGRKAGQYAVAVELPSDNLPIDEVINLIVAALRGYGATEEMIVAGFSAYISTQMVADAGAETAAHC